MRFLAGEMSGHMFFADRYFGYDDAIYASIRLLELLAQTTQPLSALLADLPQIVATPEIRVDCPDEKKFEIAERAKEYFPQALRHRRRGWRAHQIFRRLGADSRLQHPARPGPPIRGQDPRKTQRVPRHHRG